MSMPAYMIPCPVVRDFLMEYLDSRLPMVRQWRFWFHLQLCPPCSRYLRRYNKSVDFSRELLEGFTPPPDLVEHTREFLHKHIHTHG